MKVKSEREGAQSCPTLSDPMDCSLPGSSVHGIFQARVLEWVTMPSSATLYFKKNNVDESERNKIPRLSIPMYVKFLNRQKYSSVKPRMRHKTWEEP